MAMACLIMVREGTMVASTLEPALPTTGPQFVFAFVMLALAVYAGRDSKRAAEMHHQLSYTQGAGI